MKKLLIVNSATFGRLTDSYMWCKHLKNKYDITFISYDTLYPPAKMNGIKLRFVSYKGGELIRRLRFLIVSLWHCLTINGPILVVYFEDSIWLKRIIFWKNMTLDIRTFSVKGTVEKRTKINKSIFENVKKYNNVTVISEGLKDKLGDLSSNIKILPLGAEAISSENTDFDEIKLLYVGILTRRDIDKTIIGFKHFKEKYPNNKITYEIVGDGHNDELDELRELTTSLKLDEVVTLHGRLPYTELKPFFNRCNVGVSFVPKTDYYEFQPPTKTFEYIISGLYTIATSTHANSEIITQLMVY